MEETVMPNILHHSLLSHMMGISIGCFQLIWWWHLVPKFQGTYLMVAASFQFLTFDGRDYLPNKFEGEHQFCHTFNCKGAHISCPS
jgi:hypothetical protein